MNRLGTSNRTALVATAAALWAKELIDLGGRNTLLYYKDLRVGTLDLSAAAATPVAAMMAGHKVTLSALYNDPEQRADALKRTRAIHKKIRELHEERGITAGYLATGMATWSDPDVAKASTRRPAAPVLLRPVSLIPRSASEDDFTLELSENVEVNPVLLHLLAQQFGVTADGDELLDLLGFGVPDTRPVFDRLGKLAHGVPGFVISHRDVIGTFTYAKLPMVNDLQNGGVLLEAHDVVAALAGDAEAQQTIRGSGGSAVSISAPDHTPPADEFLVADADSSQSYAINAVVAGQNLVVKGPPGTGKSQTITNLVATLIARGQRVLFVAEKRAAIDAVLSRLERVDLGEWVMDLHDGAANRRKVAQDLAATLDRAGRTPVPRLDQIHRDLVAQRKRLLAHDLTMHNVRQPWGLSVFDAQAQLLGLSTAGVAFRLHGNHLHNITEPLAAILREEILEFAELGGLDPAARESPWYGSPVATPEQAEAALEAVRHLAQQTVPTVGVMLYGVLAQTGLRPPGSVAEWQHTLGLLDSVADTLSVLKPDVFGEGLEGMVAATAKGRWRRERHVHMSWGDRRRLRGQAKGMCLAGKPRRPDLNARLAGALATRATWTTACLDGGLPRLPADLSSAHDAYDQLNMELRALGAYMHASEELKAVSTSLLSSRLEGLASDRGTLARLPRRNELQAKLQTAGLSQLVTELTERSIGPGQVGAVFQAVWLASVLDAVAVSDPGYGAFQGQTLDRAVAEFRVDDTEHIRTTGIRVRRLCAEHLVATLDANAEQATLIRAEANKQRRHRPMRELLRGAPDVMLALKPCWAMSPLVVSQLLPLQQLFDVVIFDEASQIPPADAIPAILRGKRVVVAGDERQLPPTSFFATSSAEEETDDGLEVDEDGEIVVTLTGGYESILDSLAAALPFRALTWHYRSQDERLIAFSNVHMYDSSLTTFPGAHVGGVLNHVAVPFTPGRAGSEESAAAEVQTVVDLVLEHALSRADESLGVITMGIKHADRIDNALRLALASRPELNSFFSEEKAERFFVKNLERVQGDERDAVILSVGYGKSADGRMIYRFGPVNNRGGERRLNVAVSRAKKRMTLVSSFTHQDLDPNRLTSDGARLLSQYLAYMDSGGTDLGSENNVSLTVLNPFEIDVRNRLSQVGMRLTPQYGVGGYRIDFAVSHPEQPGRMVLAIEADGASYHSSVTARDRDRLRQEHLERLGWRFHRIWSTDWFRDPAREVAKASAAYQLAVADADTHRQALPITSLPRPEGKPSTAPVKAQRGHRAWTRIDELPERTLPRPTLLPGLAITEYSPRQLISMVRWIESDGLLRTEESLIRQVMEELGFRRRGKRIDTAISEAIRGARA